MLSAVSGEHLQAMPPLEGWLALAYLTVFGSIIAFNAYMYLLKHNPEQHRHRRRAGARRR